MRLELERRGWVFSKITDCEFRAFHALGGYEVKGNDLDGLIREVYKI